MTTSKSKPATASEPTRSKRKPPVAPRQVPRPGVKNKIRTRSGLTPREECFCHEWMVDFNLHAAALRAGYMGDEAKSIGSKLKMKKRVRDFIDVLVAERNRNADMRAETVLRELTYIAHFDPRVLFDEEGRLRPMRDLPEDARRAIKDIEVEDIYDGTGANRVHLGTNTKIKLHSKLEALDKAMRHLGLMKDIVQHEGKVTLEKLIALSMQPTEAEDGKA